MRPTSTPDRRERGSSIADMEDRDPLRMTFDTAAESYDRARPGYPSRLFDDLRELSGLTAGDRVVEVGPGTGQATRGLLRLGLRVVGVEPGASLAAIARRKLPPDRVRVDVADFETWVPDATDYGAVFAATSWHWVDPEVRYEKAAGLLAPDGVLALVATHHVMTADGDPFFVDIQDTYAEIGERRDGPPPAPESVPPDLAAEIAASGVFQAPDVRSYLWEEAYTADEYTALLSTYSNHIAMTPEHRQHLFARVHSIASSRPDPVIRKQYLNWLYVARRTI